MIQAKKASNECCWPFCLVLPDDNCVAKIIIFTNLVTDKDFLSG